MRGFAYILECSDGTFYTGSTNDLIFRFLQHKFGLGAEYTRYRRPLKLVYVEIFERIDHAFYREKQIQGWSRRKKKALINKTPELLPQLSLAYRDLSDEELRRMLELVR